MIRSYTDISNKTYLEEPNQSIDQLPDDCKEVVCRFLSIRDILTMEKVSQPNRSSGYIKSTWARLCHEKKIPVDWSKLFGKQNDPFSEKFTYRTEMALQYFLDDRRKLLEEIYLKDNKKNLKERIERIESCFKSVEWNTFLASYISDALQKLKETFLLKDKNLQLALEERKWSISAYLNSNHVLNFGDLLKPGELLLQGLSHLGDYGFQVEKDFDRINSDCSHPKICFAGWFLKLALQKNIVHTSLLAKKVVLVPFTRDLLDVLEDLAMFSASQKDYQALEQCLEYYDDREEPVENCHNRLDALIQIYEKIYPPMHIFRAKLFMAGIRCKDESENCSAIINATFSFKQGIEGYQQENSLIPAEAWLIGATIEQIKEEWTKADEYMNLAIEAFGESVPEEVSELRARIKENLGKR